MGSNTERESLKSLFNKSRTIFIHLILEIEKILLFLLRNSYRHTSLKKDEGFSQSYVIANSDEPEGFHYQFKFVDDKQLDIRIRIVYIDHLTGDVK